MDAPVVIEQTTRPTYTERAATGRDVEQAFEPRPGPFEFAAFGAFCGLLAGLVGLALILAQVSWLSTVRADFLTLNRHIPWMKPVTNGLLLTALGLATGPLARRFPRSGAHGVVAVLVFLATLEVLSAIEGMHLAARVLLALGFTSCVAPRLAASSVARKTAVRKGLPILLLCTAWEGALAYHQGTAESRTTAALPTAPRGTPNVLLVVLDTVRADHLSLYGYHRETTPNLDRLARLGIRFDQARAPAPYTMPSHASMFTGRWPHELNDVQYSPLDRSHLTLAEVLRDRGFRTGGFVGNTYYCNEWFGLAQGFTHYEDYPQRTQVTPDEMLHSAGLGRAIIAAGARFGLADPEAYDRRVTAADVNQRALAWLDRRRQENAAAPFFLFVNYIDAHAPYFPPADYPRRYSEIARTLHAYGLLGATQRKKLSENTPRDHEDRLVAARLLGDAYDDCIGYVDEQLGRLLSELDRRGLRENTLVIVTADHGEHLGEHELFGHATSLYQALVHVPLVIVPPRGARGASEDVPGRIVHAPVSLRAIPATVLDVLGIEPGRSPFAGTSLARASDTGPAPDPVLSELDLKDHSHTTRPGQWHSPAAFGPMQALAGNGLAYIRNGNGREELYDLAHDPADHEDLAGRAEFRPALARFREQLKRAMPPE